VCVWCNPHVKKKQVFKYLHHMIIIWLFKHIVKLTFKNYF